MDSAAFGAPDFDVRVWINGVVSAYETEGESPTSSSIHRDGGLDAHITSTCTKLQLLSEDLSDELEARMSDIVDALPRTMAELERIDRGVRTLHGDLSQLTAALDVIHHGTNARVDLLARLDLTKTNMESSVATLREAANWETLLREVGGRLASGDLTRVAEGLEGLGRSLEVLKGMPEAEQRELAVANVKHQLEEALKPRLHAALQQSAGKSGSAGSHMHLLQYVDIYRRMGQLDALQEEYTKARPSAVHKAWFSHEHQSSGMTPWLEWLPSYYDEIVAMLIDERRRTAEVFGEEAAPGVLCSLMLQTLQPITDPFSARLASGNSITWPEVSTSLSQTLLFVATALEQLKGASHRDLLAVLLSATAPYYTVIDEVGAKEKIYTASILKPHLDLLRGGSTVGGETLPWENLQDPELVFLPRVEELTGELKVCVELAMEGSVQRCMELTGGCQCGDLLIAVGESLAEVFHTAGEAITGARKLCGPLVPPRTTGRTVTQTVPSTVTSSSGSSQLHAPTNWAFLQGGMGLLQAAGGAVAKLKEAELNLASAIREASEELLDPPPNATTAALTVVSGAESESVEGLRKAMARARLQEKGGALKHELKEIVSSVTGGSNILGDVLPMSARDLAGLCGAARALVFDLCNYEVKRGFADVASLPVWATPQPEGGYAADALPQSYMTRVGEHLLSLLQQLELFAGSDALQNAAVASEGIRRLGESTWLGLGAQLLLEESEMAALPKVAEGTALAPFTLSTSGGGYADEGQGGGELGDEEGEWCGEEGAKFCNEWLTTVATACVGAFLCEVVAIETLGEGGARHLATDATYLGNVLSALELPHHPLLLHIECLCSSTRADAEVAVASRKTHEFHNNIDESNISSDPALGVLLKIEKRLAAARLAAEGVNTQSVSVPGT